MAITQNTFTGNGSNLGPFSFTFKWLESTDIKVTVAGVLKTAGTHYNLQGLNYTTKDGGQVLFTAGNAPANGAAIVIYRQTDDTDLVSTFYSGSAIRAQDLNNNFTQNLYVTQESSNSATTAITTANSATSTANTALSTANAATSTANSAVSTANSAVSTANSAVSTANSAVSTANAASASAASAVSTANTANANATAALNAAAEALAYVIVANVAAIPASPVNGDAVRVTDSTGIQSFTPLTGIPVGFVGDAGLTVEIYYSSSSSTWVWVRYYATDADARYLKLTGGTLTGQLRADDSTSVAAPVYSFDGDTNTGIAHTGVDELALVTNGVARFTLDSSGNASFTNPVTIPAGSTVTGYLTTASAASTYQTQAGMSSYVATADIGTTVQAYDADTVKTDVLPTFTVATRTTERTITSGAFDLATGNLWTCGAITVPNPTNAVAGQTGAIRITAGPVVWSSNFKFPGGTAPTIATFPAVIPYYVSGSSTILMGNAVAGIA
jgi:hypothetical protein